MIYALDLPVGALIQVEEHVLTHVGGGRFTSPTPPYLVEGVTLDGSPEAAAWPSCQTLAEEAVTAGPTHRRVMINFLPREDQACAAVLAASQVARLALG